MDITIILQKAPVIMSNGLLVISKEKFAFNWVNVDGAFNSTSFKADTLVIKKGINGLH